MSEVFNLEDKQPNQKDLVLVQSNGYVVPAIYYKSLREGGFYHFSLFYHTKKISVYDEAKISVEHEIKNVEKWCLMPYELKNDELQKTKSMTPKEIIEKKIALVQNDINHYNKRCAEIVDEIGALEKKKLKIQYKISNKQSYRNLLEKDIEKL